MRYRRQQGACGAAPAISSGFCLEGQARAPLKKALRVTTKSHAHCTLQGYVGGYQKGVCTQHKDAHGRKAGACCPNPFDALEGDKKGHAHQFSECILSPFNLDMFTKSPNASSALSTLT